ncbi:MAG: FMN-binding glutamate synthase family protein [Planctomycetes bacterium]|nr:FMN-binding glutamate synthase family protein [Planctomycetota bacterium]
MGPRHLLLVASASEWFAGLRWWEAALLVGGLFLVVGVVVVLFHDLTQKGRAVLHNFPVLGHLRYFLIEIGPELRQYIVAHNREERPFHRAQREWVYNSSEGKNNFFGFGTDDDLYRQGYTIIKQAGFPWRPQNDSRLEGVDKAFDHHESYDIPCWKNIGARHNRARPYRPNSIVNISAMSYGALGRAAHTAINLGARLAGCYHNTGEGGVSPYHRLGADVVWQIGTGKFGARDGSGKFSLDVVRRELERTPTIKMIEIKLSQGAKPGKGGVLTGPKVTPEIAAIRAIPPWKDCISPNGHEEFSTVPEMLDFIESVAAATGLPVGIKSAVGKLDAWEALAKEMKKNRRGPDFITIDGGEGGTGAAPLTFTDHVALPFQIGFARVYKVFLDAGVAGEITWIASGKLGFPDKVVEAFALGADLVNVAREAMLAIGCIQAQRCHTGKCPAGVATMNPRLMAGLDPQVQSLRLHRYVQTLRKEVIALTHAAGYEHPNFFTTTDIEIGNGAGAYRTFKDVYGYEPDHTPHLKSSGNTLRMTRLERRPPTYGAPLPAGLADLGKPSAAAAAAGAANSAPAKVVIPAK